jgi:hypothetical protein
MTSPGNLIADDGPVRAAVRGLLQIVTSIPSLDKLLCRRHLTKAASNGAADEEGGESVIRLS